MYLTKLFDVHGDDYHIHRIVMSEFPGQRPLFQTKGGCITVLSRGPALLGPSEKVEIKGDTHLFSLRVNPSKRDKQTGKTVGLKGAAVTEWLHRKAAAGGFEIIDLRIEDEGIRHSIKQGKTISLRSAFVLGLLRVTNLQIFEETLTTGIGRGKGLGFGLLHIFH